MMNIHIFNMINYLLLMITFFAMPIFAINGAQDPCKNEVCVKLLPSDGEGINVPIQAAKFSIALNSLFIDLGDTVPEAGIPVNMTSRTLSAIANTLRAMQKMKENHKKLYFRPLKWLVINSFAPDNATQDDFFHFLLAASYLDIQDLLRPAAAAWVDIYFANKSPTDADFANLLAEFKSESKGEMAQAKDLWPFFVDYIHWQKNPSGLLAVLPPIKLADNAQPSSLLVDPVKKLLYVGDGRKDSISVISLKDHSPIGNPIKVGQNPGPMVLVNNKLYVTNRFSHSISVIDFEKRIHRIIAVGNTPLALTAVGTKLYVANSIDNTISVIDTTVDQAIGPQIRVGDQPWALAVEGLKLYVANNGDNTISVIDTTNNQVLGQPIAVGRGPWALATGDNKLYVANFNGNSISVIDTMNDRIVANILEAQPKALAASEHIVYVASAEQNRILVLDKASNKIVYQPKKVEKSFFSNLPSLSSLGIDLGPYFSLALSDNKLYYVSSSKNEIFVMDVSRVCYNVYYGNLAEIKDCEQRR